MQESFKVRDSVQLLNGNTPIMTISEINDVLKEALCVWFETETHKMHKEWLPLNVLKLTPVKPHN